MFLRYLFMELKRSLYLLPKILIGAEILVLAMGIVSFVGISAMDKSSAEIKKSVVAMYIPDGGATEDMALSIVENMESVGTLCKFEVVDSKDKVKNMVENGSALGGVILPSDYIHSILKGENLHPILILPKGTDLNNKLFENLAEGGCGIFAAVQAGVYSVQDALLAKTGKEVSVLKLAELDMEYVDTVLPRATYFDTNMVNSESDLTVKEYYLAMALAMVILLAGMAMAPVVSGHNMAFYNKLKMSGVGFLLNSLVVNIIVFLIYAIIYLIILGLFWILRLDIQFNILSFVMPCFIGSIFTTAVYTLCGDRSYGGLLIFAFSMVFGFLGGAFVPVSLLPDTIKAISPYSPVNIVGSQIMGMFSAYDYTSLKYGIVFAVFLYVVTALKGAIKR